MDDEYGVNKGVPNPTIRKYQVLLRVARAANQVINIPVTCGDDEELMAGLNEALKEAEKLDLL